MRSTSSTRSWWSSPCSRSSSRSAASRGSSSTGSCPSPTGCPSPPPSGRPFSPYPFVSLMLYGRFKRKMAVEDLNKRWKHLILNTTPTTPIEPCEWLNKLLIEVWPNYMEPKLSKKFQSKVERRLKNRKPKLIDKIELQEFSLGSCPPTLGEQGMWWMTSGEQQVLSGRGQALPFPPPPSTAAEPPLPATAQHRHRPSPPCHRPSPSPALPSPVHVGPPARARSRPRFTGRTAGLRAVPHTAARCSTRSQTRIPGWLTSWRSSRSTALSWILPSRTGYREQNAVGCHW